METQRCQKHGQTNLMHVNDSTIPQTVNDSDLRKIPKSLKLSITVRSSDNFSVSIHIMTSLPESPYLIVIKTVFSQKSYLPQTAI